MVAARADSPTRHPLREHSASDSFRVSDSFIPFPDAFHSILLINSSCVTLSVPPLSLLSFLIRRPKLRGSSATQLLSSRVLFVASDRRVGVRFDCPNRTPECSGVETLLSAAVPSLPIDTTRIARTSSCFLSALIIQYTYV